MSFRILNQAPQYLLEDGTLNAGGSLTFYETDLTTLKATWSNAGLTVLNANPVLLDAEGRTVTDVFGDGEYGVVMKDADGVVQWTRNNVSNGVEAGATIPTLVDGQFLSNDGSTLQWQPILQVPDPTGLANYMLVSDGTGIPVWQQQPEPPEPPEPEYTITTTTIRIGDLMMQWGTGTVPAAPTAKTSSVSVTYGTAFTATPYFAVANNTNSGGSTPSGAMAVLACSGASTTGMTVTANVPDDDSNNNWKLGNATPFSYFVVGPNNAA